MKPIAVELDENDVVLNRFHVDDLDGFLDGARANIGERYDRETGVSRPLVPVDSLAVEQARLVSAINVERDRREESGFPYLGKWLDSDARSVQRIVVTAQAAQIAVAAGQEFSETWICADNTLLPLDGPGLVGMPVALASNAGAIHARASALKRQVLDQSATVETLKQIDILAGWPSEGIQ